MAESLVYYLAGRSVVMMADNSGVTSVVLRAGWSDPQTVAAWVQMMAAQWECSMDYLSAGHSAHWSAEKWEKHGGCRWGYLWAHSGAAWMGHRSVERSAVLRVDCLVELSVAW